MQYKIVYGYTPKGREKARIFDTMDAARTAAGEVFDKIGLVLGITETMPLSELNTLLRRARTLRKHYDLGCAYIAQEPHLMREMQERMIEARRVFAEDSKAYDRLTAEMHEFRNRHAGDFWTGSRASAAAMAR